MKLYLVGLFSILSLFALLIAARDQNNLLFYLHVNEKGISVYEDFKKKKHQEHTVNSIEIEDPEEGGYENLSRVCIRLITRSSYEIWASYRFIFLGVVATAWVFGPYYCIISAFILTIFLYFFDTSVKHHL